MRCRAAWLLGLLVAGAPHFVWAADPAIAAAETSVRLGLTAGYGHYEESISPQDTEAGAMVGLAASASALTPASLDLYGMRDLYTGISYDYSAGLFNYHGNLQDGTPYRAKDNNSYNTAIVRLGLGTPLGGRQELIPYIAGGYQNWYRNVGGPGGYGEFYQAGLLGGGLKMDIAPSPLLVLTASAEGLAVIGGRVSASAFDFSGGFGASGEERVNLDADYRIDHAWHAFAGLGLTHYTYTGSKADGQGIYEPPSGTLQVNSMFGIAYGF